MPEKKSNKSDLQKELFISIREPFSSNQSMLGAIFCSNFQGVCEGSQRFFPEVVGFFPAFQNQYFGGCGCIPCTPASYTSGRNGRIIG